MKKIIRIKELLLHLERLAPLKVAASNDNSGLLIGSPEAPVGKILITLDVTPKVVDYAIEIGADMIVSHHPLFRTAMKKINDTLILKMIRNGLSLISMHTNLDFVKDGVNGELAKVFNLQETEFLSELPEIDYYHIAVYLPPTAVEAVSEAVFAAGAGVIGNYSNCLSKYLTEGQFKPLIGSNPNVGKHNELETLEEMKLEFFADAGCLDRVVKELIKAHPYETPAYSVYRSYQTAPNYGLGLVGTLPEPMTLKELAEKAKIGLGAPFVTLWKAGQTLDTMVNKVAVCGGSGGDLIGIAEQKADVFVTSDLKYHSIIASSIPLIDAGHFFTENPGLAALQRHLLPLGIDIVMFEKTAADIYDLVMI